MRMNIYVMADYTLITPEALNEHLDHPDWRIVDCRFNLMDPDAGQCTYAQSHIPNAIYGDLNKDLSATPNETSGRHPLPAKEDLEKTLSAWGIDENTTVVAYDDVGGAFAARLWWLLGWAGHNKRYVLDGGWLAWRNAKLPVSQEQPLIETRTHHAHFNDQTYLNTGEIEQLIQDNDYVLIDARSEARFSGNIEPIDPVAGHIPGAINAPYEENLNSNGRFLVPEALAARYQQLISPRSADNVVMMCGSGVTACHNILAMSHAGLGEPKLYVGSWSEWIRDKTRPVISNGY